MWPRGSGGPDLSYDDLRAYFMHRRKAPTIEEVAGVVREIRRSKGMLLVEGDPDCRSAGSFFKNPEVEPLLGERIRREANSIGPPLRIYVTQEGLLKLPAARLIELAGFAKGYTLGAAGISSRHTLALINRGGARAEEILALAQEISAAVEARFGVRLEREPVLVGVGF
jgi:UDP-N-acetylmuramate dehydrogenase